MKIPNILSVQCSPFWWDIGGRQGRNWIGRNLIKLSLTNSSLRNVSTLYWRVNFEEIVIGFWTAFFNVSLAH